ncbi:MAG: hypothetical protein M3495_18615 [Pseudomonadota bacterium]|nr:hypothetical protein [Gammaproteobacteria bacterium]MDQ3583486.1 hypothetical protein [Pseudomonadota bacterium]
MERNPACEADYAGIRSTHPGLSGRRHPTDANDSALSFSRQATDAGDAHGRT